MKVRKMKKVGPVQDLEGGAFPVVLGLQREEGHGNEVRAAARATSTRAAARATVTRAAARATSTRAAARATATHAAARATAMRAAGRGTATWRVRVQLGGHGEGGHVSMVMYFRPRRMSSPSRLVGGLVGPQERGWPCRAVTGLLQQRKLAKKTPKEKVIKHIRIPTRRCQRVLWRVRRRSSAEASAV